jgi:hypothetical protein
LRPPQQHRTPLTLLANRDHLAELTGLPVNLDAVVQELLERGGVEDVVGRGDRVVDVELVEGLAGDGLGGSGFGLWAERTSAARRGDASAASEETKGEASAAQRARGRGEKAVAEVRRTEGWWCR